MAAWAGAALINHSLPANRTSSLATGLFLAWAILKYAGPFLAAFLALSTYLRATKIPPDPSLVLAARAQRLRRGTVFVVIGPCVGALMLIYGLFLALPAVYLAQGGDRPPGSVPQDWTVFHLVIGMAAFGLLLLVGSLVAGAFVLVAWRRE